MKDKYEVNGYMESKEFRKIVGALLKENGFYKKNSNWYKCADECIAVLHLQHSNFGPFYYINLATFIRKNDPEEKYPRLESWRVRLRTPDIGPKGEPYQDTLNLGRFMLEEKRRTNIKKLIEDYCIPMLNKLSSIDGIKKLYKEDPDINYANPYKLLGIK